MLRYAVALLCLIAPFAAHAQSTWSAGTCGASITLSNGNLTASKSTGAAWQSCHGTPTSHSSGKFYFEESITAVDGSHGMIYGMMNASGPLSNFSGSDANSVGVQDVGTGDVYYNGTQHSSVAGSCVAGGGPPFVVGFAVTVGTEFWCTINGVNWSPSGGSPATPGSGFNYVASITGAIFPSGSMNGNGGADTTTLRTLQSQFTLAIPSGFSAWDSPATASFRPLVGVGK